MAKAKKKTSSTPPATAPAKKPPLAARRRARRAKKNPARSPSDGPRANPPIASDLTHVILPGFGAYAATRVAARIVFSIVTKRWPKLGKHAHAASGLAAFAAAWFFAHKVKRLAKYHDGVLLGSGIAALHGIAQAYLPVKYRWLLADCKPEDVARAQKNGGATGAMIAPVTSPVLPAAGDEYSYLEAQLDEVERGSSKRTRTAAPPKATRTPIANAMSMAAGADDGIDLDPDLMEALGEGEDVDDLYSGSFEN